MTSNQSWAQFHRGPTSGKVKPATAPSWSPRQPSSSSRAARKRALTGRSEVIARSLPQTEELSDDIVEVTRPLDLRPVAAAREDVQVGVGQQPHHGECHVERNDAVLAA